jgi:hypothetical protein
MKDLMLMTGELPVEKALISTATPKESLLGLDVEGYSIVMDDEVHRRIVACVNACRGLETEKLEVPGTPLIELIKAQSRWHDELEETREQFRLADQMAKSALRERDEARAMVAELVAGLKLAKTRLPEQSSLPKTESEIGMIIKRVDEVLARAKAFHV